MAYAGGCACGAVRFAAEGEPKFVGKCYCTHCHKESGTGHITVAAFPEDAVTVTGEVKVYKSQENGSKVERLFCPNCGATLMSRFASPGSVNVRVGAIDDSSGLSATLGIFGKSASPWDAPPAGMTVFPEFPPRG